MGMLTAMQIVKEAIKTKQTCLKQNVKITNMFRSNRRVFEKKKINQSKDIKWIVVILNGTGMFCTLRVWF